MGCQLAALDFKRVDGLTKPGFEGFFGLHASFAGFDNLKRLTVFRHGNLMARDFYPVSAPSLTKPRNRTNTIQSISPAKRDNLALLKIKQ
jgi:hypothetical protein